jgi:hypothetical protein
MSSRRIENRFPIFRDPYKKARKESVTSAGAEWQGDQADRTTRHRGFVAPAPVSCLDLRFAPVANQLEGGRPRGEASREWLVDVSNRDRIPSERAVDDREEVGQ